jgi:hypothetical protein
MRPTYALWTLILTCLFGTVILSTQSAWSVKLDTEGRLSHLQLQSPRDGQTVYTKRPTLRWSDPEHPPGAHANFKIQIAENSGFSPYKFEVIVPGTQMSYTIGSDSVITASGTYYWRVRIRESSGRERRWTSVANFSADLSLPPRVRTIRPAPSQVVTVDPGAPTPGFEVAWECVPGSIRYHVQLSTNRYFSSVFFEKSTPSTPEYRGTLAEFVDRGFTTGEHFWRVRAERESGWGEWSDVVGFIISQHTMTLRDPANGSRVHSLRPILSWNPASGARNYDVTLSPRSDLANPVFYRRTDNTSASVAPDLEDGKTYYWQVTAGGDTWSSHSPKWSFTVSAIPDIPWVTSPRNGSRVSSLRPTLSWSAVPYATSYQLELREGSISGRLVFRLSPATTSIVSPYDLSLGKKYVWIIKACNRNNECSGTSSGWFEVGLTAPKATPSIPKPPPGKLPGPPSAPVKPPVK